MSTLQAKFLNLVVILWFTAFSFVTDGPISGLAFLVAAIAVVPLLTPEPKPGATVADAVDRVIERHPDIFKAN